MKWQAVGFWCGSFSGLNDIGTHPRHSYTMVRLYQGRSPIHFPCGVGPDLLDLTRDTHRTKKQFRATLGRLAGAQAADHQSSGKDPQTGGSSEHSQTVRWRWFSVSVRFVQHMFVEKVNVARVCHLQFAFTNFRTCSFDPYFNLLWRTASKVFGSGFSRCHANLGNVLGKNH